MRISGFLAIFAASFTLMARPTPAEAGGFHITILGVKRTAMGTTVAAPDDTTALFHNPAGLADQSGSNFYLSNGITFIGNDARLQALDPVRFPEVNPPGCGEPGSPPCPNPIGADGYYEQNIQPESAIGVLPYLGYSQDLSALNLDDVVVSVAAYAPGAYGAAFNEDAPTSYYIIDGYFVIGAVTMGAGWRINEYISIGANVSYNYMQQSLSQKFSTTDVLTDVGAQPSAIAEVAQNELGDLRLDYTGTDHGFGWGLGVLINPTDWLSFGAGYGGFSNPSFSGDLTLESTGSPRNGNPPRNPEQLREFVNDLNIKLPRRLELEMKIPPSFAVGTNIEVTPWLEIGVDIRYWLYRLFTRQILRPIYDDGPGDEPITEEGLSSDKNFGDSWQTNLGVLVAPLEKKQSLELMAGISFDKSPVPDETFSIDNPSLDQLAFAVGFRSMVSESWRIGASYQYTAYLERDVTTSQTNPPTNVRLTGRAHIPTVEVQASF